MGKWSVDVFIIKTLHSINKPHFMKYVFLQASPSVAKSFLEILVEGFSLQKNWIWCYELSPTFYNHIHFVFSEPSLTSPFLQFTIFLPCTQLNKRLRSCNALSLRGNLHSMMLNEPSWPSPVRQSYIQNCTCLLYCLFIHIFSPPYSIFFYFPFLQCTVGYAQSFSPY